MKYDLFECSNDHLLNLESLATNKWRPISLMNERRDVMIGVKLSREIVSVLQRVLERLGLPPKLELR